MRQVKTRTQIRVIFRFRFATGLIVNVFFLDRIGGDLIDRGVWRIERSIEEFRNQISFDDGVATFVASHQRLVAAFDDFENRFDEKLPEPQPLFVERRQQDSMQVELVDQQRFADSVDDL